jgi:DNA end-binding protein Ku
VIESTGPHDQADALWPDRRTGYSLPLARDHTREIHSLAQVWQPTSAEEPDEASPRGERHHLPDRLTAPRFARGDAQEEEDQTRAATRISLRPHDPSTGEEVEKDEVVKGYEYQRGQFVTFTPEELKALDVESSKVIDLEKFMPRGELDPVYFDRPYYLYPDGPIAIGTLRVIGAAMAEAGVVGLGRLTLSRRERMVMVEPRGTEMALFTLRAADEIRAAQFPSAEGELDPEMVAIARAIIVQRTGKFDPSTYRDRYQEALRDLMGANVKELPIQPRAIPEPSPVIDLMAALKRSLEQEAPAKSDRAKTEKRAKAVADRRQPSLLLPVSGGHKRTKEPADEQVTTATRRRKKA